MAVWIVLDNFSWEMSVTRHRHLTSDKPSMFGGEIASSGVARACSWDWTGMRWFVICGLTWEGSSLVQFLLLWPTVQSIIRRVAHKRSRSGKVVTGTIPTSSSSFADSRKIMLEMVCNVRYGLMATHSKSHTHQQAQVVEHGPKPHQNR